MKPILLLVCLLGVVVSSCTQQETAAPSVLSVREIADKVRADDKAMKVYDLQKEIQIERTATILAGVDLPTDAEALDIMHSSESTDELKSLFADRSFPNAAKLAALYAHRNELRAEIVNTYKPLLDGLTKEEKVELATLLPNPSDDTSSQDAALKLQANSNIR